MDPHDMYTYVSYPTRYEMIELIRSKWNFMRSHGDLCRYIIRPHNEQKYEKRNILKVI